MQLGKYLFFNRFKIAFILVLLSNIILAVILLFPNLESYLGFDLWNDFTSGIVRKFYYPSYVVFSGIPGYGGLFTYWHSITPLYPFLSACLTLLIGNIPAASIIVASACSFLSLVFFCKSLKEYCLFNDDRTYIMLNIYASFYMTAQCFCIPSPISIVPFFAIMDMYFVLKYFKDPSGKNLAFMSFVFTATTFSREILWPIIAFPFIIVFVLLILVKRGKTRGVRAIKLSSILLLFVAMLIPVVIYACYFVGLNLFHALGITMYNLNIMNNRSVESVLYNVFTTITFYWIFVAISFIYFGYSRIRGIFKNRARIHDSPSNGNNNHSTAQVGDIVQEVHSFEPYFHEKFVNAIFVLWFSFYILYRIIVPGPFWAIYYFPVLYLASFFVYRGIQTISKDHFERTFWIILVIMVLLNLANLFRLDPFWWSFSILNM